MSKEFLSLVREKKEGERKEIYGMSLEFAEATFGCQNREKILTSQI
jgi:hypothetical protein